MAGLLDTIIAKRAQASALNQRAADAAAMSTEPAPPPSFDEVKQTPLGITQDESDLVQRGTATRQFGAGLLDVKSGIKNAIAATTEALGGDPVAMRRSAIEDQRRADKVADPNVTSDIRDIDSPSKLGSFVFGHATRGAPMIGAMALGAGAGMGAGVGALAGAGAVSLALNAGEIYGRGNEEIDALEKRGEAPERVAQLRQQVLMNSGVGGAVSAALDAGAFGYLFKLNPATKGVLMNMVSKSLPGHTVRSLLAEGGTEALQAYVSQVAIKNALERPDQLGISADEAWQIANAGAAGASMAAPLAPIGHFRGAASDAIDSAVDKFGGIAHRIGNGATLAQGRARQMAEQAGAAVAPAVATARSTFGAAANTVKDVVAENAPGVMSTARAGLNTAKEIVADQKPMVDSAVGAAKNTIADVIETNKPMAQSVAGAAMNTAQAVGELAYTTGKAMYTAAKPRVLELAGQAKDQAIAGMKMGYRALSDMLKKPEPMSAEQVADLDAAIAGTMAEKDYIAKWPAPPKKSQAATLSDGAKRLRDDLLANSPGVPRNDATLLAKQIDLMLRGSAERFDEFLTRPEAAAAIADSFDLTTDEFRQLVFRSLDDGSEAPVRSTRSEEQGALYGETPQGFQAADNEAVLDAGARDQEEFSEDDIKADFDAADVLAQVDTPNEDGVDNPMLDPDTFSAMLAKPGQKTGSKRWVMVTETEKNKETGEVISERTTPQLVNFMNIAKAWQSHTKANTRMSDQSNMDANFKEGVAALFNGWQVDDEVSGNTVETTIQPARQVTDPETKAVSAVPIEDFGTDKTASGKRISAVNGWLRPNDVVGKRDGQARTISDIEEKELDPKRTKPKTMSKLVDNYYYKVGKAEGQDKVKERVAAADDIARFAVQELINAFTNEDTTAETRYNKLTPEQKNTVVDRTMEYVNNPTAFGGTEGANRQGVPGAFLSIPMDILAVARGSLVARLSDLDLHQQQSMRGEQETSVDNLDKAQDDELTGANDEVVTQDMAGDFIDYRKDERAGRGATPLPKPAVEAPAEAGPGPERAKIARDQEVEDRVAEGQAPKDAVAATDGPKVEARPAEPVDNPAKPETAKPSEVSPQAQVMKKLRQLYSRAETSAARGILNRALDLAGQGRLTPVALAALAKDGLKPSDVKRIIAATDAQPGPGSGDFQREDPVAKKA